MRPVAATLAILAAWPCLAAQVPFHHAPAAATALRNPYRGAAAAADAGRQLYAAHCAACHGRAGEGTGNIPVLAHEAAQTAPDGAIFWFITKGSDSGAMPSWAVLPERQRWQLVTFLKTLPTQRALASAPPAAATLPVVAPPLSPPFTDFRYEQPGTVRKIGVGDLPPPYATHCGRPEHDIGLAGVLVDVPAEIGVRGAQHQVSIGVAVDISRAAHRNAAGVVWMRTAEHEAVAPVQRRQRLLHWGSSRTKPRAMSPAARATQHEPVDDLETLRLLYVLVVIHRGSRRLLHFNVTTHPTAAWTLQQLREAIRLESAYRYLIHDRDSIFARSLDESIKNLGLTMPQSPPHSPRPTRSASA